MRLLSLFGPAIISPALIGMALIGSPAILGNMAVQASEPIVVLTYGAQRGGAMVDDNASNHPFRIDPDYNQTHEVKQDETLGHIIHAYYGGSGMNMKFVEMAIVALNRRAFVRGNPNFLYAKKTLHLPSLNEIRALAVGEKLDKGARNTGRVKENEIFFFGG